MNRDINRDIDRDIDIDGDWGHYSGGHYWGAGLAAATAVGITAAAIGSIAYALPSGCGNFYVYGSPYYNCGGTYYAPQYSGGDVTYIVVEQPEGSPPADQTELPPEQAAPEPDAVPPTQP